MSDTQMSDTDTVDDRKKIPVTSLSEEDASAGDRHYRHHHRHEVHRDAPRGGCYSSANDEGKRSKLFAELTAEKERLDPQKCPHLYRLIQTEISRVAISPEAEHSQEVDLYNDYPITLNVKCFPPTKLQPNFNYAGRIIGPKGAYLKALMRETRSKIVVLGHGVMKDKEKERELRNSEDPKYLHLNEEMHFSVTVSAPASEAYERMSNAITCLKSQVLSDSRDLLSLPWIFRVVENGAAPPKGAHIPRSSAPTDSSSSGFGRGVSSPPPPKRRVIAPPCREREARPTRNESFAPPRPRHPRQERGMTSRSVQSYDEYESGYGRSGRSAPPYPRTPPPVGEAYYRDAGSGGRNPMRPRTRRSPSTTPSYDYGGSGSQAAAEATSSYYAESQDRNSWSAAEGRAHRHQSHNPRSKRVRMRKHKDQEPRSPYSGV